MIEGSCVSEDRCRLRVVHSRMLRKGEMKEQRRTSYCDKELHNLNSSVCVVWVIMYRGITHV
jgi:hypothetical protein